MNVFPRAAVPSPSLLPNSYGAVKVVPRHATIPGVPSLDWSLPPLDFWLCRPAGITLMGKTRHGCKVAKEYTIVERRFSLLHSSNPPTLPHYLPRCCCSPVSRVNPPSGRSHVRTCARGEDEGEHGRGISSVCSFFTPYPTSWKPGVGGKRRRSRADGHPPTVEIYLPCRASS